MNFKFNYYLNYFYINLIVLTLFAFISTIATDVLKCTIGSLEDCPPNHLCDQLVSGQTIGHCVCNEDCPQNQTVVPNGESLPIYSNDNNSNSNSVIVSSILATTLTLLIIFSAYYFGVRRGLFREVWIRTFTQRQVEHQLLDRSPATEDNDTEAIA